MIQIATINFIKSVLVIKRITLLDLSILLSNLSLPNHRNLKHTTFKAQLSGHNRRNHPQLGNSSLGQQQHGGSMGQSNPLASMHSPVLSEHQYDVPFSHLSTSSAHNSNKPPPLLEPVDVSGYSELGKSPSCSQYLLFFLV